MSALEVRLTDQMRAVVDAEAIFGADSVQHRRQVAKMVRLQAQHAKAVSA